jgi:hypothetical protein
MSIFDLCRFVELTATRTRLQSVVPSEPAAGTPEVTTLRIRTHTGTTVTRRFPLSNKLSDVKDFVDLLLLQSGTEYPLSPYSFKTNDLPPRTFTTDDFGRTLAELSLQNCTLYVHPQ